MKATKMIRGPEQKLFNVSPGSGNLKDFNSVLFPAANILQGNEQCKEKIINLLALCMPVL